MKKLFTLAMLVILGAAFPAFAVNWEVTYPVGGKASSVDDVQIKCTEVAYRYLADDATATLYDAADNVVKELVRDDITLSFRNTYCTVDFEFSPAITEAGTYRIAVSDGAFSTTGGETSEAFSVSFTVETSSYTPIDVTFNCVFPEGGKAAVLDNILLISDNNWDVVSTDATADVYDASFTVVATLTKDNIFPYQGGVMVVLEPAITTPGSYMLVLNEGAVIDTAAGVTNNMAMVELTVETPAPTPVNWEVTYPVGGKASSVDDVQIKCTEVAYRYLADDATATLYDAADNVVKELVRDDITLSFRNTYCTVDFEFSPAITEPGTYFIAVPEGAFSTTNGEISAAFLVSFTVEMPSYTPIDVTFNCVFPEGGKAAVLDNILLISDNNWDVVSTDATADVYDASFTVVATLTKDNIFPYQGGVMVVLEPAITTPGSYMLVLNEGAVIDTAAGVTNNMAGVELTVESATTAPEVITMPDNGTTVSNTIGIQAIYIMVEGYKYIAANQNGVTATIKKDGNAYATLDASVLSVAMDQTSVIVNLPEDAQLNEVGTYVVSLPEGFFTMKSLSDNSAEAVESPAIELHYTIAAQTEQLSWTISPAPGEVDKIDHVAITFNKPVKIATTNNVFLFYTNSSFLPETVTDGYITLSEDGLVANIDFSPVFADGGIFQIRLYEGNEQLSVVDGEYFPGINITYKVNAPLYTECTPAAETPIASLDEVKIILRRNVNIAEANFAATFKQGDTEVAASLQKLVPYDWGDPSYIVVKAATPITTPGEVTLVIAEGSLTISNYGESMPSPETSINFVVNKTDGVDSITTATSSVNDVYNTLGVCVKRNASATDIRSLSPGIYIVGGHKVVVK